MDLDRRAALLGATFTSTALADAAMAQVLPVSLPSPVTSVLCRYIVQAKPADLPEPVKREVRRTVLNYTGVAVGGSRLTVTEVRRLWAGFQDRIPSIAPFMSSWFR